MAESEAGWAEAAASSPPPVGADGTAEREELISGMLELAALCTENGVPLPERIRHTLRSIDGAGAAAAGADDAGDNPATATGGGGRNAEGGGVPRNVIDEVRMKRRNSAGSKELLPLARSVSAFATGTRQRNIAVELRMRDVSYTVRTPRGGIGKRRRENEGGGVGGGGRRAGDREGPFVDEENVKISRRISKSIRQIVNSERGKVLLEGINLRFESGKMYLVLGSPGCGKSLLLRSIAGRLRRDRNHTLGGTVSINGQSRENHPDVHWSNLVAYADQVDRHHARLTVKEVLNFAFQCRARGTHRTSEMPTDDPDVAESIRKFDEENWRVNAILKGTGLERAQDTFLGDEEGTVRGISGGERKRVTLSETFTAQIPFICMDEMSTGLDAATTFTIVKLLSNILSFNRRVVIMSLLQPPPEVVALFDELILLDKGRIVYAGPVDEVVSYFEGLGYFLPDRMDMADWLQTLTTPDGAGYIKEPRHDSGHGSPPSARHLTHEELVDEFRSSERGLGLVEALKAPQDEAAHEVPLRREFTRRYQNPWHTSLKLCFRRELLLLRRDERRWKMKIGQNLVMGVVSGTLFWQVENQVAIVGVLFYVLVFVTLGNMPPAAIQLATRGIFYKEQDANFYPTSAFVLGRALASFPMYLLDSVMFGTIVFFFSGMAYNGGASIGNYFIFLLILLVMGLCSSLVYAIFASASKNKPGMQAKLAILCAIFVIFSGFTVQPDVIPVYWLWLYWINLFAWAFRALAVNEFQSGKYDDTDPTGDQIMEQFGLVDRNDEAFEFEWVWWGVLFLIGMSAVALIASTLILDRYRVLAGLGASSAKKSDAKNDDIDAGTDEEDYEAFDLPFKRVDLTFAGIRYTVETSISKEPVELLKGIDGMIESGKMTAIMGSSGAGKTTLMDVLALRKTNGEVDGIVKLNGHLQEAQSFRRCTGYVEQFDLQSPQLTIFETVQFSAKLRLNARDEHVTTESTQKYINKTLHMLELTPIKDLLVGSDLGQGLSFEQKKRLSIAVELVSNPAIIFLDEPTSGLDARAARVVMRGLRKIALTGRAICATIHQPSNAIFNGFDSLLLLKRGGETIYFGDLGTDSRLFIEYLEQFEATAKIVPGENPATWMLNVIGAGSNDGHGESRFDYAASYQESKRKKDCLEKINVIEAHASDDNLISYPSKYATDIKAQSNAVYTRLNKIYWRSPSYNLSRVIVSGIIALMMGSMFAAKRTPTNESDMNSRMTSVFITAMFLGVTSFNTTLPVFERERNMFYRHKAALMYNQSAIPLAFSLAEVKFVLFACMIFMICFYFMMGFSLEAYKFFLFYLFSSLNMFTWTYLGQMTMSLLENSVVAQQMGSVLVGMATLFAGILIRPQLINGFWIFMYWSLPVQYILQGMIASQFHDDNTKIEPYRGSDYSKALEEKCGADKACWEASGTAEFWVEASFGGVWAWENLWYCGLYLLCLILASRVITYIALTKLNYLSK